LATQTVVVVAAFLFCDRSRCFLALTVPAGNAAPTTPFCKVSKNLFVLPKFQGNIISRGKTRDRKKRSSNFL
jgi:hypothetical protein